MSRGEAQLSYLPTPWRRHLGYRAEVADEQALHAWGCARGDSSRGRAVARCV